MKWFFAAILLVAALIVAAWVAPLLLDDPGQVVVGFGQFQIEMPLLVAVGSVVVIWMVFSILSFLIRLPARLIARRRQTRSREQMESGFLALTEGDWARAERLFEQSLSYRHSTAGLLGAARAAQGRSDREARDQFLARADQRFGRGHFVTQLAKARLLLEEGTAEAAIKILEDLHLKKPKHVGVLRLLLGAYQDHSKWRQVREVVPALKRAGMVDSDKARELEAIAAERELAQSQDYGELQRTWKALGHRHRQNARLVLAFAERSRALGHFAQAGRLLSDLLDQGLDAPILAAYRTADENTRASRIQDCERRLAQHPDHPGLLETLGFLYLDAHEFDKAQTCLEQAVKHHPSPEIYRALGRLMDRLGQSEAAARYYRNALQSREDSSSRLLS